MPHVDEVTDLTAQTVIVYGPPKSGKTDLVCRQLARHYNVYLVDLEKGRTTLAKFPTELKSKIDVIPILDNKDAPNAISACVKLAHGGKRNYCLTHQKIDCVRCKTSNDAEVQANQYEYHFNELDPQKDVVVFDSFTQLTSSATAHIAKETTLKGGDLPSLKKFEFDDWSGLGVLLERFLDYIQNSQFNVVVITHEMGVAQADGVEKLMPSGGTKNFARKVSKYFDHIVYCNIKNRKHTATSSTTAEARILTGSRTDVEVSMEDMDSMARLLGKKGLPALAAPSKSSKKSVIKSKSSLLRK